MSRNLIALAALSALIVLTTASIKVQQDVTANEAKAKGKAVQSACTNLYALVTAIDENGSTKKAVQDIKAVLLIIASNLNVTASAQVPDPAALKAQKDKEKVGIKAGP